MRLVASSQIRSMFAEEVQNVLNMTKQKSHDQRFIAEHKFCKRSVEKLISRDAQSINHNESSVQRQAGQHGF